MREDLKHISFKYSLDKELGILYSDYFKGGKRILKTNEEVNADSSVNQLQLESTIDIDSLINEVGVQQDKSKRKAKPKKNKSKQSKALNIDHNEVVSVIIDELESFRQQLINDSVPAWMNLKIKPINV